MEVIDGVTMREGARVGRYTLLELLDESGVRDRWRAKDASGQIVWLDMCAADTGTEAARQWKEHAYNVRRASNMHRVLDRVLVDGRLVLVMEALAGEPLDRVFARQSGRGMSSQDARVLADRVLAAVSRFHASLTLHLALCPRTIWQLETGRICLTDPEPSDRVSNTLHGFPLYMAPEQWNQEERDERTDLYAVGLVIAEALQGRPVRDSATIAELAVTASDELEPPNDSVLAALIAKLSAVDPVARHASANDARAHLRELLLAADAFRLQYCPSCRYPRTAIAPCESCDERFVQLGVCGACETLSELGAYCAACGVPRRNHDEEDIEPPMDRTAMLEMSAHINVLLEKRGVAGDIVAIRPVGGRMRFDFEPRGGNGVGKIASMKGELARALSAPVDVRSLPDGRVGIYVASDPAASASPARSGPAAEGPTTMVPAAAGSGPTAILPAMPMALAPPRREEDDGSPRTVDHHTLSVFAASVSPRLSEHASTTTTADVESGDELLGDRYRRIRKLGAGGQSTVFLVEEERNYLRDKFALRIPLQSGQDPEELANRLKTQHKREKILSDKAPTSVVRLHRVEKLKHGDAFIVGVLMEYMEGGTLEQWVKSQWGERPRTRAELGTLMSLFVPVLRFLHELHSGVQLSKTPHLHRDIKPSNILVDANGTQCKLTDFYLTCPLGTKEKSGVGTPQYMAPECFAGEASVATEVFAIGATLYELLSGRLPFGREQPAERSQPTDLATLNPIVPIELSELVHRCMEDSPQARPATVREIMEEIVRLGLTGDAANAAPTSLARLLVEHLSAEDLDFLAKALEADGMRSHGSDAARRRAALIEEHCYSVPPHQVLAEHCTTRQLATLAATLDLKPKPNATRSELIDQIVRALGFRSVRDEIPGIESARRFLDDQLVELAHATSSDEALGRLHSAFAAVERVVDLLVRFYGQLLHGAGLSAVLRARHNNKPASRLTLGEKIGSLRAFAVERPTVRVPRRVAEVFEWPILPASLLKGLGEIGSERNKIAHSMDGAASVQELIRRGRQLIGSSLRIVGELANSPNVPTVVQIVSRMEDVHGRHSYIGHDDRDRTERIFTPLPLELGTLYLFYGVTNPVRINPLLFPYALDLS